MTTRSTYIRIDNAVENIYGSSKIVGIYSHCYRVKVLAQTWTLPALLALSLSKRLFEMRVLVPFIDPSPTLRQAQGAAQGRVPLMSVA